MAAAYVSIRQHTSETETKGRLNGSLNGLDVLARLYEVVDGSIELLMFDKPVAPLVLQRHHLARKHPSR